MRAAEAPRCLEELEGAFVRQEEAERAEQWAIGQAEGVLHRLRFDRRRPRRAERDHLDVVGDPDLCQVRGVRTLVDDDPGNRSESGSYGLEADPFVVEPYWLCPME